MENYSEKVYDHFYNPRNMGEISDADGIGEVGNVRCGDTMYIYIKVAKRPLSQKSRPTADQPLAEKVPPTGEAGKSQKDNKEEYIKDIKFKTLGCAAAIASSSMMTELVKGKTLDEAMKVTRDDISEALGILPKQKYHCSILSAEGIYNAIKNYRSKQVGSKAVKQ